jgi:predicted hydrocarbon binding protein
MEALLNLINNGNFTNFEKRKLGKFYGSEFGRNVLSPHFLNYLNELSNFFMFNAIGKVEVEENQADKIVFIVKSRLKNCKFFEGFFEGFLEEFTNSFWSVRETSCFRKCRFVAINF